VLHHTRDTESPTKVAIIATLSLSFSLRINSGRDLAEWLERLTANAEVATVLGSILTSSVES
jgi:hypothetical protein